MGILTWIVVGAVSGWLAGQVLKGRGLGLFGDVAVGVVGAILGGWLAGTFFNVPNAISGYNVTTFVVAFLGSVIVLFLVRMLR